MGSFIDYIAKEWGVISRAPVTSVVGGLLIAAASVAGASAFYKQEVATAHEQRDLWKDKANAKPTAPDAAPVIQDAPASAVSPATPAPKRRHLARVVPSSAPAQGAVLPGPPQAGPTISGTNSFAQGNTTIGVPPLNITGNNAAFVCNDFVSADPAAMQAYVQSRSKTGTGGPCQIPAPPKP